MNTTNSNQHIPVLLERVLDVLQPTEGESYLDLTSGYGGHARAIIEKTGKPEAATLVDQDSQALEATHDLQDLGATPIHLDFASAVVELGNSNQQFDMIVANILANPLIELAPRLQGHLAVGGRLLLAGLLDEQASDVMAAYPEVHFRPVEDAAVDGPWRLLEATR